MAKIKVTISSDGTVDTEVQGVKGSGCAALLDALTRELGEVTEDHATPEYWEDGQGQYVTEGGW